jgi:hypothetical protein
MRFIDCTISVAFGLALTLPAGAAAFAVGAAPKGDASVAAARIIKHNFPACSKVASAVRKSDGSIRASCDGKQYLVFTVFNPKEGKLIEVAMNCAAAKQLANITC